MNKYKRLIQNTALFGAASFSSKILSYLMLTVVLTRLFEPAQYGIAGLITSTCNFIVPLISACIHEAVIRFGMDNSERKQDVFTSAMLTIFLGYLILILGYPILSRISPINNYLIYIYIYAFTSAMRSTVTHFVRASGFVRIFALDSLLTTINTIVFTFVYILGLNMGVSGYITAIITADAISAFGLIILLKLYRFFRPKRFNRSTMRTMLRYCMPLVPTAIFWWITNLSDRYLVIWISGEAANGLYEAAYKIPNLITLVSAFFIQAWQISAFTEYNDEEGVRFYSTVFDSYHTLVFLAASGLILIVKPIMSILDAKYYEAWRFAPLLVLAVAFSCLVTFLGTIYNAAKANRMASITTFVGAVINIILNLLLIPIYGPNGASFATFVSYFAVFLIRVVDTRRFMKLRLYPGRIAASLVLILLQIWIGLQEPRFWIAGEILIFILLFLCNLKPVLFILRSMLPRLVKKRTT